jgi:hypothetical protein
MINFILALAFSQDWAVLCIICIITHTNLYQLTMAPASWVHNAETLTDSAMSAATIHFWILMVIFGLTTPYLIGWSPVGTFCIFGALSLACSLFVLVMVKETKGLTEAEISNVYSMVDRKVNPVVGKDDGAANLETEMEELQEEF